MTQLAYTEEELMREHAYAELHYVAGERAHGGYDGDGNYISPRSLVRSAAVEAWGEALRARGGEVFEADPALRTRPRWPSLAQQKLLIREGLDQSFWNSVTITGLIEGRGRFLVDAEFPDLQTIIVEDISEMAIGHLRTGLLKAHGLDEGGMAGVGGHDVMWFAVRDLAMGKRDFPQPVTPDNIGRPEQGRLMPEIPGAHESMVVFLMNLLMIEFSAENLFSGNEQLLRDPDLFCEQRSDALLAAEIVDRIRTDEVIHIDSLATYLGELRSISFKTLDGGTISGAELIDRVWKVIVHFFIVEAPELQRRQQAPLLRKWIAEQPDGERVLARFDALETRPASTA